MAAAVNGWAGTNEVFPISGQASREVTVRNLRYYRSLALLDGPVEGGGYGPKHFLQVAAIRLLQARGLPLDRIRDLLYGRSKQELAGIFHEDVDELHQPPSAPTLPAPTGQSITADQLEAISHILESAQQTTTRKPNQLKTIMPITWQHRIGRYSNSSSCRITPNRSTEPKPFRFPPTPPSIVAILVHRDSHFAMTPRPPIFADGDQLPFSHPQWFCRIFHFSKAPPLSAIHICDKPSRAPRRPHARAFKP